MNMPSAMRERNVSRGSIADAFPTWDCRITAAVAGLLIAGYSVAARSADPKPTSSATVQSADLKKESTPEIASTIINLDNPLRAPGRFLVFLKPPDKAGPSAGDPELPVLAETYAREFHGKTGRLYSDPGVRGFAIEMSDSDAKALAKNPQVDRIYAQLQFPYPLE
jgi:hypothetical protein